MESKTIGQTISELQEELCNYIEATYHISHPFLIKERKKLLQKPGVIFQTPYLESTPRYKLGHKFEDLKLDDSILQAFNTVLKETSDHKKLIYNPPYSHQADAIEKTLIEGRDVVITTGTGSGKTECFLLPILGKLARESFLKKKGFGEESAVRALILYPMNALVNDQLARLRLLFGDSRLKDLFIGWSGRPVRFSRYTSRTLYPGVRDSNKDKKKLKPIEDYFIKNIEASNSKDKNQSEPAKRLISELKKKGKWPAKENLRAWYGEKNQHWKKNDQFNRCNTMLKDSELLTRHEVFENPPDILVTNYSMLEYMLMRPIEQCIFDKTCSWLRKNPNEKLLLVVDEAHLYRGAAGAEVALLLRRLRARLGIETERLQIICTSASFSDSELAKNFVADLTGKDPLNFNVITGELDLKESARYGVEKDARLLREINLKQFYDSNEEEKLRLIKRFLEYRKIESKKPIYLSLYNALKEYEPLQKLINISMQEAISIKSLSEKVFPDISKDLGDRATSNLIALASMAKESPSSSSLLPCRVHAFFRGLSGLWVCLDKACSQITDYKDKRPTGKLYSQPKDTCKCGAKIFELYTCRNCGAAYARGWIENEEELESLRFLWNQKESLIEEQKENSRLEPIDLLLEKPSDDKPLEIKLDILSGQCNPNNSRGNRVRSIYIQSQSIQDEPLKNRSRGQFYPCAVCDKRGIFGRSTIQDHQTSGDQPFQALVTKQISVQPPGPQKSTRFAPLRGRKTLIFSDSRQVAARLAPNLKSLSTKDALRPLLIKGFNELSKIGEEVGEEVSLNHCYLAVLLASVKEKVRLYPETGGNESNYFKNEERIKEWIDDGYKNKRIIRNFPINYKPPVSLLHGIYDVLFANYYGIEDLALASIVELPDPKEDLKKLPDISGVAETEEQKIALVRTWIKEWTKNMIWMDICPDDWKQDSNEKYNKYIKSHKGKFRGFEKVVLRESKNFFNKYWLPKLLEHFCEKYDDGKYRLRGSEVTLSCTGEWAYCNICKTTQRPFPDKKVCFNCGKNTSEKINPDEDSVFSARKKYYRKPTTDLLENNKPPISLITAEHTAQLNSTQLEQNFSKAEEYELLFQDINLDESKESLGRPAIDVLSCTTTMEVGIDIGSLSGVALRNMSPSRASYQQRSGRAGRRANAVATVIGYASTDSHDEHYFKTPEQMIKGEVKDPFLNLNNISITERHIRAYLLQMYHRKKCQNISPNKLNQDLFSVLGTVDDFRADETLLNFKDFERWIKDNRIILKKEISNWIPKEIQKDIKLDLEKIIAPIKDAIRVDENRKSKHMSKENIEDKNILEIPLEGGANNNAGRAEAENLLERLLYKGVLPRYAFPTDVVCFYVFDKQYSYYNKKFQYSPSQNLSTALSQYAPGKDIWIDGKLWQSSAIYSPIPNELFKAWKNRKVYFECSVCEYAICEYAKVESEPSNKGRLRDCPACRTENSFGPGKPWLRPPGFAHPFSIEPKTSPEDQPELSYATRAKLQTPVEQESWNEFNKRIKIFSTRQHLFVTNRGPKNKGYSYCAKCGSIEPVETPKGKLMPKKEHHKPFPDAPSGKICEKAMISKGIVLGTDFPSDILLISLNVDDPVILKPKSVYTKIALRTVCEALSFATTQILDLETREVQGEYRSSLKECEPSGKRVEIYLYDTLPGGAGFSSKAGDDPKKLFEQALKILKECPSDECVSSCYRCIRSYKNKFDHSYLDRELGTALLLYLMENELPMISSERLEQATNRLYEYLKNSIDEIEVKKNFSLESLGIKDIAGSILVTQKNGKNIIITITHPLAPSYVPDDNLSKVREGNIKLHKVNELSIKNNLPKVIEEIKGLL